MDNQLQIEICTDKVANGTPTGKVEYIFREIHRFQPKYEYISKKCIRAVLDHPPQKPHYITKAELERYNPPKEITEITRQHVIKILDLAKLYDALSEKT